MDYLGTVKGLGYDGNILVKGEFTPKPSQKVMDKGKRTIGSVLRIFGPVNKPFITVRPPKNHKPSLDIIGKDVYVKRRGG